MSKDIEKFLENIAEKKLKKLPECAIFMMSQR